jgi:misacylated tRNA(Ala) deacylase
VATRIPSRSFYHLHPDVLLLQTRVVQTRRGRVVLAESPFFPGGGGQLPDRGSIRGADGESEVKGFDVTDQGLWHVLADPDLELAGPVEAVVDPAFRLLMRELHTGTHVLNAVVFQRFDGALVTGAQMMSDGTARMDFDLPAADNDQLRAIEPELNDAIREDLRIGDSYLPLDQALREYGLIRNRSVAPPPTDDGKIRIVEIAGLDRQACGGTHLSSTGASPPIRIIKIDNKGRHNRRVYIALAGRAPALQ